MNLEAKVGSFVILCLLLLGATVYYVGNEHWSRHTTPYRTYLRYAGGIAPGTHVLFGGIDAGEVTAVRPSGADPTRIEIALEVAEGTPVNENSVAKLGSVSVMSSPAIAITTGTNDAPRLRRGEVIRSVETVSLDDMARKLSAIADSAQGLITEVQADLRDVSGRARTLLANLNDVTGTQNRHQIAELLRSVNALVVNESPKIDHIADEVLLATRDADSTIQRAGPLLDHVDATVANVNVTIDQLRDPVRADLAQLEHTLDQARSTMETIQTLVRANGDNIDETVENLRVATDNLDQLTDSVKQQPWSLIRIRQPKDRKLPQ